MIKKYIYVVGLVT